MFTVAKTCVIGFDKRPRKNNVMFVLQMNYIEILIEISVFINI